MALDVKKQRWVAKDGSVFVEKAVNKKFEHHKRNIPVQEAIAFNVGADMAKYIVDLHNARLQDNEPFYIM